MNEEPNRMSINGNLQNTMQHSKYANSQHSQQTKCLPSSKQVREFVYTQTRAQLLPRWPRNVADNSTAAAVHVFIVDGTHRLSLFKTNFTSVPKMRHRITTLRTEKNP